ncbi:MAG: S24/S26 family peptidase [Eubacterium sp.]|nr:S24/S26 family peptidase [Eubacterium sp.]MBQ8980520.1 S24/S26 family peptidase [Eubacterium sp.]MBR1531712.1 S24/S26 family peptidase [Eubacterium sp.]MBR2279178.1 S24/S26 family peptidase [Eubacterium sp.]
MPDMTSIKEILDTYGKYSGLTSGTSMLPLLHQGKDTIIVVKPKERLKKYDVALYVTKQGKYIMHRVVEVHDDHYIITGDNLLAKEYVTDDMICGKLVGFYKNGKHFVDCENSKAYKIYSKVWVAGKPLRPALLFCRRGFNFAKRLPFIVIRKIKKTIKADK